MWENSENEFEISQVNDRGSLSPLRSDSDERAESPHVASWLKAGVRDGRFVRGLHPDADTPVTGLVSC